MQFDDLLKNEVEIGGKRIPVVVIGAGGALALFLLTRGRAARMGEGVPDTGDQPPTQPGDDYGKQIGDLSAQLQSALSAFGIQSQTLAEQLEKNRADSLAAIDAQQKAIQSLGADFGARLAQAMASMSETYLADLARVRDEFAGQVADFRRGAPGDLLQSVAPSSYNPQTLTTQPIPARSATDARGDLTIYAKQGSITTRAEYQSAASKRMRRDSGVGNSSFFGNNPEVATARNYAARQYSVVRGDTLSRIAKREGLSLAQVIARNPQITNPNLIRIGQTINL